jgi:hypothetical protein
MRGGRVARERRALRSPNIVNRGLHRQTDFTTGWNIEQGQAVMRGLLLSVMIGVGTAGAALAQQAMTPREVGDKVGTLEGKPAVVLGILAYRGMGAGTLGEQPDIMSAPFVELDFSEYPLDKLGAIPSACKAAPGAAGGCKAEVKGTVAKGSMRPAALKVSAIEIKS